MDAERKEKEDRKVMETYRIINRLRESEPLFKDLMKALKTYEILVNQTTGASQTLLDAMLKISEHRGGDLGDGLRRLADCQYRIEEARMNGLKAFVDQLGANYEKIMEADRQTLANVERNYKNQRSNSLKSIKKAENRTKKAEKKKLRDPRRWEDSLSALESLVEKHAEFLADSLNQVATIDRKKYCTFIKHWNAVVDVEARGFEQAVSLWGKHKEHMLELQKAETPTDTEEIIAASRPRATLSQLKAARETGNFPDAFYCGDEEETTSETTSDPTSSPRSAYNAPSPANASFIVPSLPPSFYNTNPDAPPIPLPRDTAPAEVPPTVYNTYRPANNPYGGGGAGDGGPPPPLPRESHLPQSSPMLGFSEGVAQATIPHFGSNEAPLAVSMGTGYATARPSPRPPPSRPMDLMHGAATMHASKAVPPPSGGTMSFKAVAPYKARVKRKYVAQSPQELTLQVGEIFDVYEELDSNWGRATVNGVTGLFPLCFIEKMIRAGSAS
ncbi:hypothetical protein QOT17_023905 [Balamuthia mandrillaris]